MMRTLSIDCGGSGIKGCTLGPDGELLSERIRVKVSYPLSPRTFLGILDAIAEQSATFDRATVGLPGIIRHGQVVHTPHYPRLAGPRTEVDQDLAQAWAHWDLAGELRTRWGRDVMVLNDAEMQGAAVVSGVGLEVMLTLGTGLGCAIFDGGSIAPKLELSHATVRKGQIYDQWLGAEARRQLGVKKWSRRIHTMLAELRPVFWWDRVYLGGGEAKRVAGRLPHDVVRVPNIMGIVGGARAWDLTGT